MTEKGSINTQVVVIGGGLAGLCSAIHLSQKGIQVTLIEKGEYPRHKVCGEYVSNEVLPYLNTLGIDPFQHGAIRIDELDFSTPGGKNIQTNLPLGGFSLSRFRLDEILYLHALKSGVTVRQDTIVDVSFKNEVFKVISKKGLCYECTIVIGAYGKRSVLDKKLGRSFIEKRSSYVAVKAHYNGIYPKHQVGLYNFDGGYCGVSNIENGQMNMCYIVDSRVFNTCKNFDNFQKQVMFKNEKLKEVYSNVNMIFKKPLSISQISFDSKPLIEGHILMCGDSAGMIHPLCGNGMGMAIGSAQLVSETILSYFNREFKSRDKMEKTYQDRWNKTFKKRLTTGHALAKLLNNYRIASVLMPLLQYFPILLRSLIRSTHGKPAVVK